MPTVSIIKGDDPEVMVNQALNQLGGLELYVKRGQSVFIKPNVCGGVPGKPGSFTNPVILSSMIRLLKDMDVKVMVGEADSCMYTADVMLPETGVIDIAEKHGAEVVNLSHGDMVNIEVPKGYVLSEFKINKMVKEADTIISMPVMKTHSCTTVTLGVKGMLGVMPERKKSKYHPKLDHVLVDIVTALTPKLTLIDATTAMEGEGPFKGETFEFGIVIAGDNVVSTDACAATVMGFNPNDIDHLMLAHKRGLGSIDVNEIEIKGESLDSVRRTFTPARQEKRERFISRLSKELGYRAIHREYEKAVRSWKEH